MKPYIRLIGIALLLSSISLYAALRLELPKAKTEVEFLATGTPSSIKIKGKSKDGSSTSGTFTFNEHNVSGNASLPLISLDTGIELRTRHMQEKYLETNKWPMASLTLTKLALPNAISEKQFSDKDVPFEGKLTLHGIEKPIQGTVDVAKDGTKITAKFRFKLLLSNFGIEIPKYLGITVAEDVATTVDLSGHLN